MNSRKDLKKEGQSSQRGSCEQRHQVLCKSFIVVTEKAMWLICARGKSKSWKDIPALIITIWIAVYLYSMWPVPILAMNNVWKSEKHADLF